VHISPPLASLLGLTTECATPAEYEQARLEWLARHVGIDTFYFGPAAPETPADVRFAGVKGDYVGRCESNADRYWPCRLRIHRLVERAGGVVVDDEVLSERTRDAMPFYHEVTRGLGIRSVAVSILGLAHRAKRSMYLGRTSRGLGLNRKLPLLAAARGIFALGAALHEVSLSERGTIALASLTSRELEVLSLVCRGLSNREVAAACSSSPCTVKNQVASILAKTGTSNRTELASRFNEDRAERRAALVELSLRPLRRSR
jgi:DNA-binding CsgD family transcriptional regulator